MVSVVNGCKEPVGECLQPVIGHGYELIMGSGVVLGVGGDMPAKDLGIDCGRGCTAVDHCLEVSVISQRARFEE